MGREYILSAVGQAITYRQMLIGFDCDTNDSLVRIKSLRIGIQNQEGSANEQQWAVRISRWSSPSWTGSGGTSITPAKRDPGDAASVVPSAATGASGEDATDGDLSLTSSEVLYVVSFPIHKGLRMTFPGEGIAMRTNESNQWFVVDLITVPDASTTINASIVWEEIGDG